ncbi:hypothetical protein ACA910_018050 [Epithemia clementina (nom. ined.)]
MLRRYWAEGREYQQKPHVLLTLVGRFKQTNGLLKTFIQPLAPVTSSGIRIQTWLGRTIQEYDNLGVKTGPLFRVVQGKSNRTTRATVSHLDLLHDVLRRLQHRRPNLLGSEVKVEEEYSTRCSFRREASTEAQNQKIPQEIIELNNRWKKHIQSRGVLPSMTMIEQYSDAKASVEAIIQFSELM